MRDHECDDDLMRRQFSRPDLMDAFCQRNSEYFTISFEKKKLIYYEICEEEAPEGLGFKDAAAFNASQRSNTTSMHVNDLITLQLSGEYIAQIFDNSS